MIRVVLAFVAFALLALVLTCRRRPRGHFRFEVEARRA
jgi:hypothetical protein